MQAFVAQLEPHFRFLTEYTPAQQIGVGALFFATWNVITYLVSFNRGFYTALKPEAKADFRSRIPAFINAALMTIATFYLLYYDSNLWADVVAAQSEWGDVWCYIFGGYTLYDTIHTLIFMPNTSFADYLHHAMCAVAVYLHWQSDAIMVIGLSALALMEVTNPFYHLSFLLKYTGKGESSLFFYNAVTFALTYFVFRVLWCTYLCYHFTMALHARGVLFTILGIGPVIFVILTGLSYFWFKKILAYVAKSKAKSEKSE